MPGRPGARATSGKLERGHRAGRRRPPPLPATAGRQAGRAGPVRYVAPRFADRPGGYTRIVRLAKPRLGDAGTRAILEFVGVRDRVVQRSVRPTFEGESATPANSAREVVAASE